MVILWGAKCFGCPFFVGGFFEVLCGWGGGVSRVTSLFLKCFAAGGVPRLASPILFAPAGVTENKES